jgi:hypothetical protein
MKCGVRRSGSWGSCGFGNRSIRAAKDLLSFSRITPFRDAPQKQFNTVLITCTVETTVK